MTAPIDLQKRFAAACGLPIKLPAAAGESGSASKPSASAEGPPSPAGAEGPPLGRVYPCSACEGKGGRLSDWGHWLLCDECEGTGREVYAPARPGRAAQWLRELIADEMSVIESWLEPEQLDALCAIAEQLERVARQEQQP